MPRSEVLLFAALLLLAATDGANAQGRLQLFFEFGESWIEGERQFKTGAHRDVVGAGGYLLFGHPTFFRTGARRVTRGGELEKPGRVTNYQATYLTMPVGVGRTLEWGDLAVSAAVELGPSVLTDSYAVASDIRPGEKQEAHLAPLEFIGGADLSLAWKTGYSFSLFTSFFADVTLTRWRPNVLLTADRIRHRGGSNNSMGLRIGVDLNPASQ